MKEKRASARVRARAVEPEGVVALAVERDERGLGIAPGLQRAVVHARAGVRRARRRATPRAPRRGPWARVRSRKLRSSVRPCSVRDRLGVELHAPQRPRAVLEPHDDVVGVQAVTRSSAGSGADDQRVVADGREALRDAGEEAAPVVVDRAQAPVHDLGRVLDRAAADVGERLVAEADAEHRQLGALQRVERDADVARVLGAARARARSRCCPPPAPRARPTTARRCAPRAARRR